MSQSLPDTLGEEIHMSLKMYDYELTSFTGRQNEDPLLTIMYSLGQIMAGLGPIFVGPLLGAILTLGGIAVIGLAQGLYQENERRRREETAAKVTESGSSSSSSRPILLPPSVDLPDPGT